VSKLLTWNAHKIINDSLKGSPIINNTLPDGDALFLDYLPPTSTDFLQQVEVIKHYVKKKINIFIYDKTLSIKSDEAEWLKHQKIKLYEPALKYRDGFKYLPLFCPVLHTLSTIKLNTSDPRPVSVGYKGIIEDKVKSFEKYYVEMGKNYPSTTIQYNNPTGLDKSKINDYTNFNVTENTELEYKNMKCMVLLGSYFDYSIGYLPDIFTPLSQNVIILLPEEHRYYHSLFSDTIVRGVSDISYFESTYDYTYIGYIVSIYERIEKYFPEMTLQYTLDVIKEELCL